MALWSTSCQGKRHGVGKGGERGTERRGERKGTDGRNGRQERKRIVNGERGGRWERGEKRGSEEKRRPLVGNAAEYREFYGGGSAN